jgi:hypothetical protein
MAVGTNLCQVDTCPLCVLEMKITPFDLHPLIALQPYSDREEDRESNGQKKQSKKNDKV